MNTNDIRELRDALRDAVKEQKGASDSLLDALAMVEHALLTQGGVL